MKHTDNQQADGPDAAPEPAPIGGDVTVKDASEALLKSEPSVSTDKAGSGRSGRSLNRENLTYCVIFLRNSGELVRATVLARDVLGCTMTEAIRWAQSVTLVRETVDNSKARALHAENPCFMFKGELEDSYRYRASHWPSCAPMIFEGLMDDIERRILEARFAEVSAKDLGWIGVAAEHARVESVLVAIRDAHDRKMDA